MDTNIEIEDILKRLYTIENCLLQMTDVIDMARNYETRLIILENEIRKLNKEKILKERKVTKKNKG